MEMHLVINYGESRKNTFQKSFQRLLIDILPREIPWVSDNYINTQKFS